MAERDSKSIAGTYDPTGIVSGHLGACIGIPDGY